MFFRRPLVVHPQLLSIVLATSLVAAAVSAQPATKISMQTPSAQEQGELTESLRPLLEPLLEEVAGFSVAVARDGEIVVSQGLGWADLEQRVAASPATRYLVHSAAKAWTMALAAQLIEEDRFAMTDPVAPLVPGWPADKPPITLLQLATHSSGIRHYHDEAEALAPGRCSSVADAIPIFASDPLLHQPGAERGYSSWGFVLLSAAIEGAAGVPFGEALAKGVLEPAGMVSTVLADPIPVIADRAETYRREDGELVNAVGLDSTCKWGAGGYLATAEDLVRFYIALFDERLISAASVQLITSGAAVVRFGGSSVGGRSLVLADRGRGVIAAIAANTQARELDLHAVLLELVDRVAASSLGESPHD